MTTNLVESKNWDIFLYIGIVTHQIIRIQENSGQPTGWIKTKES